MQVEYNTPPKAVIKGENKDIYVFSTAGENISDLVVRDFGLEWMKFKDYSDKDIRSFAIMYFDILDDTIINKNTYALDIGCGTGRWTKYLSDRIGFIEAIDPSSAVVAADHLLRDVDNVRISKASVETIPFDDETFDFVMSIGVLHHIPDTQKAMIDCVKKVKRGGFFYVYLYHNLDGAGRLTKMIFRCSETLRNYVSKLPPMTKKFACNFLAVTTYLPFVFAGKLLRFFGLDGIAKRLPLSDYQNKSFFIIRNDALDKYGTTLEQRFSRDEVITLMRNSGLGDIVVSPSSPYYHAIGKKL